MQGQADAQAGGVNSAVTELRGNVWREMRRFFGGKIKTSSLGLVASVLRGAMGFLPLWFSHRHPCVLFHLIMVFAAGR